MKQLLEKLAALERDMSSARGDFRLFALLLREEAPGTWDLIVSASWLQPDKRHDWDSFIKQVRARLTLNEFLILSRIVLLETDNPVLKAIQKLVDIQHGLVEITDCALNGMAVKHAYVITSNRNGRRTRSPTGRKK